MFQTIRHLLEKLPAKSRPILLTTLYGLCAGLSSVIFEVGINQFYARTFLHFAKLSPTSFMVGSFVVVVVTSLIAGFLLSRFCPEAAGSGIPQLKLAFWKRLRLRTGAGRLGQIRRRHPDGRRRREPRTRRPHRPARRRRVLVAGGPARALQKTAAAWLAAAAGAAAGLAAAFNAPLASITFVLEEIVEDLNSRLLGSILYAAVLGALVVHAFIGSQPAFSLREINVPTWRGYLLVAAGGGAWRRWWA